MANLSVDKKLMLSSTQFIADEQRKLKRRPDIQEEGGAAGCCFLGGATAKKPKKKKKKADSKVQRESPKSLDSSMTTLNECKHTGKQGEVCPDC